MKNRHFRTSFKHAADGIVYALRCERNFRTDIVCAAYVIWFASACGLSGTEWAVLFAVIGAVLFAELINTAIERAVDAFSEERSEAAKNSKDTAAGAVLAMALGAAAAGAAVFVRGGHIAGAVSAIIHSPARIAVFAVLTAAGAWFVFLFGKNKK